MSPSRACRICGKPVPPKARNPSYPLCRPRCRQVDLGRWMTDAYVISSPLTVDLERAPPASEPDVDPNGSR